MHRLHPPRPGTTAVRRFIVGWLLVLGLGSAQAQLVVPVGGTVTVPPAGTVDLACTALDVQGSLSYSSGQINLANNVTIGGTVNAGTGHLTVGGNWVNNGTFTAGTGTVSFVDGCNLTPAQISGTTVFNNLTLASTTGRSFIFPAGSSITVNGTLTLQGSPGNPVQIIAPGGQAGTSVIQLGPNAQVVRNHANVAGNVQIGNPPPASVQAIPTLGEWAMLLLGLLVTGLAVQRLPQRQRRPTRLPNLF